MPTAADHSPLHYFALPFYIHHQNEYNPLLYSTRIYSLLSIPSTFSLQSPSISHIKLAFSTCVWWRGNDNDSGSSNNNSLALAIHPPHIYQFRCRSAVLLFPYLLCENDIECNSHKTIRLIVYVCAYGVCMFCCCCLGCVAVTIILYKMYATNKHSFRL